MANPGAPEGGESWCLQLEVADLFTDAGACSGKDLLDGIAEAAAQALEHLRGYPQRLMRRILASIPADLGIKYSELPKKAKISEKLYASVQAFGAYKVTKSACRDGQGATHRTAKLPQGSLASDGILEPGRLHRAARGSPALALPLRRRSHGPGTPSTRPRSRRSIRSGLPPATAGSPRTSRGTLAWTSSKALRTPTPFSAIHRMCRAAAATNGLHLDIRYELQLEIIELTSGGKDETSPV